MRIFLTDIAISLRNVARQRRRSAIAVSAVGFGVIALLLAGGFIEWVLWSLREGTIYAHVGHIQVMRPGYLEAGAADPYGYILPDDPDVKARIEATPEVRVMGARLSFSGLVSHGDATISFIAQGVEQDKEHLLSRNLWVFRGEDLSINEPRGILMGIGLANILGVGVGDSVVLLTSIERGGINAVECRVRGLFYTVAKAYDDSAIRVPLDTARELMRVSGSHQWIMLLDRTEDTPAVLAGLRAQFGDRDLQFLPWNELAETLVQTEELFKRQFGVVQLIIGVIIVLSISNTMMMSVMERTGEIGTAMALGVKRARILRQFLTEGILVGIIGGVLGLAIGWLLATILSYVGIPMPPPPGVSVGITASIFVTPGLAAQVVLLAFVTTLAASLYPAYKGSRMNIVDALRQGR